MDKKNNKIHINEKVINVKTEYDKKSNNTITYIEDMKFDNIKELFYFINMLSDIAELCKNKEDYAQ